MRWWRHGLARLGVRTGPGRDAVAAGLLLVLLFGGRLVVAALVAAHQPVPAPPTAADVAIGFAVTVADCVPIALRRRWPRAALLLALAVILGSGALGRDLFADPGPGLVVCAYTVTTLLPWRRAVPLLGGVALLHAAAAPVIGDLSSLPTYWGTPGDNRWATAWASAASVGVPALIGSWVQTRRAYTAELVDRAERLRAERDERARTAVLEERGRIARELHDIAAHDLSAMVVQAGAADRLVERDPDAARATLKELRAQGRDTLSQLRRLVGVMRGPDSGGLAPQPSLLRLDDLVAGVREAGAAVEVVTTGAARLLPPEVDLAAYRVVQEALVNTRRHAAGAAVRVEVDWSGDGVRVAVRDTGPAGAAGLAGATGPVSVGRTGPAGAVGVPAPRAGDGGNGLLGMRERVRLAGGTLRVGSTPDGGWLVEASLPAGDR